jgi:hypothetical protein
MFCVNCTYGDSTPATHDVVGTGPKCCYDNDCDTGNCKMIIKTFVKNQLIDGWVTLTNTGDENIIYGPFKTEAEAQNWLPNLVGGEVLPIFVPSFNKG